MVREKIIEVRNLTKVYETGVKALNNVSFDVHENEVFGLLGPNGAGKTTLLLILATLLKPSSGIARVCGYDVIKEPANVRKCIGVVFQEPSSDDMLTAYENLKLHAYLFGISKDLAEKKIREALKLVGLENRANEFVKHYSGGMRRRLEIARGLLHEPKLLLLDEPTIGLDPKTREIMWGYLEKLVEKGVSIVLTTHYMEEAEKLCNRVAIIDYGKISAIGSVDELKASVGGELIVAKFDERKFDSKSDEKIKKLEKLNYISKVELKNGEIRVIVSDASKYLQEIINYITKNFGRAEAIEIRKPSLDDVFIHYTGREFSEERDEEGSYIDRIISVKKKR